MTTLHKMINGIDTEQMSHLCDTIKAREALSSFRFKVINHWEKGTLSLATVQQFYGGSQKYGNQRQMVYQIDNPDILFGENLAANPEEYLLVSLSGCLTTSLVAHAAVVGIELKKVESSYEGEIDLMGSLGLSRTTPIEYKSIKINFTIDADINEDKKGELLRAAQIYSPVYNSLRKSVPITVALK